MKRGERGLGMGGHHEPNKGAKDEWLTPPRIIGALGPFDLDPCAPVERHRPWPTAAKHYTIEDDGLAQEWDPEDFVWCNPPYGPETWKWLDKLHTHGNGIALIFARTETSGFFEEVWKKADAMLFLRGRLFFHYTNGTAASANAGAPSVLVAYGRQATRRLRDSGLEGAIVSTWGLT